MQYGGCGPVLPDVPLWQCFLSGKKLGTPTGGTNEISRIDQVCIFAKFKIIVFSYKTFQFFLF